MAHPAPHGLEPDGTENGLGDPTSPTHTTIGGRPATLQVLGRARSKVGRRYTVTFIDTGEVHNMEAAEYITWANKLDRQVKMTATILKVLD